MSKISQPCHVKPRSGIQAWFCLGLFLLSLQPVRGAILDTPETSVPVQSVIVTGILSFQDETDSGAPPELGKKIALLLKQRLSLSFKDVLPKTLSPDSDATVALTVEQLTALGKQSAVQFVVRGGLLALTVTESNITAQLYAEIISVESGAVSVVRAEGTGAGGNIQWSRIDLNSASFSSSAPGPALTAAIESLASSVHQALLAPVAENSSAEASDSAENFESTSTADAAAADEDEELQQLIAQAEEIVTGGAGDANNLQQVSSGLQKLKAALVSKASLIEGGADPTRGDQQVAAAKSELQAALTTLNEQTASVSENSEEATQPTGEKKSLLSSIDQRASEALGILQRIQEMRAAFRGTKEASYSSDAGSEGSSIEASEQPTEDVSGVVMQEGEPIAGVEVAVQNSKVTAITGPDGSYTLKALPAGKLSNLVLKKNGKQLAVGQIDLLRGRQAVADFDVKLNKAPAASALRIIPSTIVLKRNGPTGMLKGIARDQAGKPLPRVLVSLNGPSAAKERPARSTPLIAKSLHQAQAVARTDSQGHYAFLNVPAGEHLVTVQKSGSRPMSARVSVKPNAATETQSQLTVVPRSPARDRQRAILRTSSSPSAGSGGVNPIVISRDRALGNNQTSPRDPARIAAIATRPSQPRVGALRGQVVDSLNRKPIAGANVSIAGRRGNTDQAGNYEFSDLAPGNYLAKITIPGFADYQQSISIRAGAASREEFALKRLGDSNRTVRVPTEAARVITQTRFGQVRGRVVDAASGAPITGAIVAVSGGQSVVTGRDGGYSLNALPQGSYHVIVKKSGFADSRGEFKIRAGEVSTGNFGLISTLRKPVR